MSNIEKDVSRAWRIAAEELGIAVDIPFALIGDEARQFDCIGLVHEFGSQRGTLLFSTSPPDFAINGEAVKAADAAGYCWSAINVALYNRYDRDVFIDALRDWGFVGPPERRPEWL